jgi:3-hydroxyisobutyrate dehydrogenase-like beta-hydroxyacid dehydrogenase
VCSSPGEVASRCERVVLSLPDSRVTAVVLPELAGCRTVIDTTTGDPEEMAGFSEAMGQRGINYLEANVAGSSRQAADGVAVVLAAGREEVLASCRDLLDAIASRVFFVGPAGHGACMKLVVNLALGLNRAVLAEALGFAGAVGVDTAVALEVLRAGPAHSRAMDTKGEKMLAGEYAPEARLRQHHKDVRLILESGRSAGARLPLSELHEALLAEAEERGFAEADNSAIYELFRRRG